MSIEINAIIGFDITAQEDIVTKLNLTEKQAQIIIQDLFDHSTYRESRELIKMIEPTT